MFLEENWDILEVNSVRNNSCGIKGDDVCCVDFFWSMYFVKYNFIFELFFIFNLNMFLCKVFI